MNLKDRWNSESTKIGKIFHTWIAGILLLCSTLGAANEYLAVIPPDFVPQWVKTMVVISGIISFVGGKLTKRKMLNRHLILGIVVLLFISVANIGIADYFYNKYRNEKKEKEGVEQLFSKEQAKVEMYKNLHGQIVTKNEGLELENKTIKQLVKDGNLPWLKEFEGLKKNYKNLEFGYQLLAKSIDSLHVKLKDTTVAYITSKGDTVLFKAYNWDYKDKWSEFKVKQLSPTLADFEYKIDVPIEGVYYWKRKWFLGKKHYFAEVTSENPHVKIPELLNLKAKQK